VRRLTILLAVGAALLLVPAAQAFGFSATMKLNVAGSGSGEVIGAEFGFYEGTPPMACSYESPGPAEGTCENSAVNEANETEGEGPMDELLEASAGSGSEFAGWTIQKGFATPFCGAEQQEPLCLIGIAENEGNEIEATAIFCLEGQSEEECLVEEEPATPNLKLNVEEGSGTVVSNPAGLECTGSAPKTCEAAVAEGKVTLTASPAPGYLVKSWKGCDVGGVNGRQCTVTATSSLKTVGVKFYKVWNLEISKANPNGSASTSPGGVNCGAGCLSSAADYKPGTTILKAKPAKNFHFVKFQGGTGSAASCNGVEALECTITLGADSTIEEVFTENAKNTLSLTKTGGGQGFVKTKPTNVNCGYTCGFAEAEFFASEIAVPVTVTLNKGTTSVTWSGASGGTTCTSNQLTCTVDMSSAQSLTAEFK